LFCTLIDSFYFAFNFDEINEFPLHQAVAYERRENCFVRYVIIIIIYADYYDHVQSAEHRRVLLKSRLNNRYVLYNDIMVGRTTNVVKFVVISCFYVLHTQM